MPNRPHRSGRESYAPSTVMHDPDRVVYLLIADGFEEPAARACQTAATRAGLKPIFVAQTVRPVIGSAGTPTPTGLTIERVRDLPLPRAILLLSTPGTASFVADPRLSILLARALDCGVIVGVFPGNLEWLARTTGGVGPKTALVVAQGARPTAAFLAEVFDRVERRAGQPTDAGTHPLTRVP